MINADFFQRQCPLFFPEVNGHTYGSAKGRTAEDVNRWTGGWLKRNTTRLLYSNGYAFTASGCSGRMLMAQGIRPMERIGRVGDWPTRRTHGISTGAARAGGSWRLPHV